MDFVCAPGPSFSRLPMLLGAAAFLALLYCALTVQDVYAGWENPLPLSPDLDDTTSVALGDLDGDGDLDIVVGNYKKTAEGEKQPSKVYLNDGNGIFQKSGVEFPGEVTAVAVGDLNSDGALDILFGKKAASHEIYLNKGSGHFELATTLNNAYKTTSVAMGDVDGDGWLDIVAGNELSPTVVYTNLASTTGVIAFSQGSLLGASMNTQSIALGDVTGDDLPDIIVGNDNAPSQIYPNTKNGFIMNPISFASEYTGTLTVALGDMDGNGSLDIVVAGEKINDGSAGIIFNNDGQGNFSPGNTLYVDSRSKITNIALGDVDNDGDLDIGAGIVASNNGLAANVVFLNGSSNWWWYWSYPLNGADYSYAYALTFGDLNNDGFLDIVTGNVDGQDEIYLHNRKGNTESRAGLFTGYTSFSSINTNRSANMAGVALGDIDNNGALDIIATDKGCYLNLKNGTVDFQHAFSKTISITDTSSVALGDLNGDNRLDLVAGYRSLETYLNESTQGDSTKQCSFVFHQSTPIMAPTTGIITNITFGDVDNDEDLDIIAAGKSPTITVALNNGAATFTTTIGYSFVLSSAVSRIGVGDLNSDGALDIVATHLPLLTQPQPSKIYFNDGTGKFTTESTLLNSIGAESIAIGDLNSDGALDIVVAIPGSYNLVYLNNGTGGFIPSPPLAGSKGVTALGLGDLNGDGALDIVAANNEDDPNAQEQDSLIYFNDGKGQFSAGEILDFDIGDYAQSLALGDLNGDGFLEIVQGAREVIRNGCGRPLCLPLSKRRIEIYQQFTQTIPLQTIYDVNLLPNNPNRISIQRPGATGNANFYSTPEILPKILDSGRIPITYTLFDRERDPVGSVELLYSLDGGGRWYTAAATNTITNNLATVPFPTLDNTNTHTFTWDIYKSGFFGQSDNVVLRLKAYPQEQTPQPAGSYRYTNTVAGPYQWPYASAMTFPFRVRGTQVRVIDEATQTPVTQARVYRLPQGQLTAGFLLKNANGPLVTDAGGFLQGREQLASGDRLIALAPTITHTVNYQLYHTSPVYDLANLSVFTPTTVAALGVQKLVVSSARPLLLFNLAVSLEWDASGDTRFREDLQADLARVSQILYDWSNGQAALGNVTIYHNKEHWQEADIRIYATNRLRPYAKVGGITRGIRSARAGNQTILFARGQVHIGATWNRYGDAGIDQRTDWINTLAHELGHYLFFLLDNYVGQDTAGRIIDIRGCPGVMSNPYDELVSEFHPEQDWLPECSQTLSQVYLGRSDWATIRAFYPDLSAPHTTIHDPKQAGPPTLPLAVTHFQEITATEPSTMTVATFTIVKDGGAPYVASSQARAFLFKNGAKRLLDLGTPRRDQVKTWNATAGDTLCIYDLAQKRPVGSPTTLPTGAFKLFLPLISSDRNTVDTNLLAVNGCATVDPQKEQIQLHQLGAWQPDVVILPQGALTISVEVRNIAPGLTLLARHYPANDPTGGGASEIVTLTYDLTRRLYTGLIAAKRFAPEAYIHLYRAGLQTQGVVVDYALGGAPTLILSDGDTLDLSDGSTLDLSDGSTLTVKRVDLSQGSTLVVHHDGLTLLMGEGSILTLGDDTKATFSGGNTLTLSDGSTLDLSDGSTLDLSDGSTLDLSDGSTLDLSDGGTLDLSDGSTLDLSDGSALVLNTGEAPVRSSDGQMTLYVTNVLDFGWGDYYTVQQATILPNAPAYATPVGQGYRITASPSVSNLLTGSLTMHYFGRDVASSKEQALLIYHWSDQTGWRPLPTTIDEEHNSATAISQGVGIYALMYSEQIPLVGPAWNNFAYPVRDPAPLPAAVASIAGRYSVIWGYVPNPVDGVHWLSFDPTLEPNNPFYDRINTLKELAFGRAYWIYMRESGILYLVGSPTVVAASDESQGSFPATINRTTVPPAIFYGAILPSADFTPSVGMEVTAWINDKLCGQNVVQAIGGQPGYVLEMAANSSETPAACGVSGAGVTFKVNGVVMATKSAWDNTQSQQRPLLSKFDHQLSLPLIQR